MPNKRTLFLRASGLAVVLWQAAGLCPGVVAQTAHFHHVRLNVTDRQASIDFYTRFLGATEVLYRGRTPALFTERSFLLLAEVKTAPLTGPKTAIAHIGWAGINGPQEYDWLREQGVEFQTPVGQLGDNYGMYLYGPDRELIEIWTGGRHHRFDHIHFWASDVQASCNWFSTHLGLGARVLPRPKLEDPESLGAIWMGFLQADSVNLVFFGRPDFETMWWPGTLYEADDGPQKAFEPTRGSVVDRIGFSYLDIDPVLERMESTGAEIVRGIETDPDFGFRSFLVAGPDGILVEIVEERSIPDEIWD